MRQPSSRMAPKSSPTSGMKYEQLAEYLRDLIVSRSLQPGDSLPTFAKMRSEMGISQSTYLRAHQLLDKDGLISRLPRRGAFVAQTKQSAAGRLIALAGVGAIGRQSTGYWEELIEGIRDGARAEGKSIVLLDRVDEHADWTGVTGVITGGANPIFAPVPCVSLLRPVHGCMAITADEFAGMSEAMTHLIGLGHRQIAYLHAPSSPAHRQRLAAYRNEMMDAGIAPDPRWSRDWQSTSQAHVPFYDRGFQSMSEWLDGDWKELGCTAILAQNDDMALGVIAALRQAGIAVPEDVSVVGFDGILSESSLRIELTTVAMPLFEIGRAAVRYLRSTAEVGFSGASLKLTASLRVGTTTGPAR